MFCIINLNKNYQKFQTYFVKNLRMRQISKGLELIACVLLAVFVMFSMKNEQQPAMVKADLSILIFIELLILKILQSKNN